MDSSFGFVPILGDMVDVGEVERPLSAPPPPGFVDGPAEQRETWILNGLLAASSSDEGMRTKGKMGKDAGNTSDYTAETSIAHTFDSSGRLGGAEGRTSSFGTMAACLGTGLVESMDNDREADPSLQRMARHVAIRMGGGSATTTFPANERTGIFYAPTPAQGFPTTLSSPPRNSSSDQTEREKVAQRSTTPVGMFPGHRRGLPTTIAIGTHVVEPEEESHLDYTSQTSNFEFHSQATDAEHVDATIGSDSNRSLKELERGVKNMWVAGEFKPAPVGPPSQASSISEPVTELSPRQAEADLRPFLWDGTQRHASRTLAILRCSWLRVADVRAGCEQFGVLDGFRADFSSRGIYFASYVDIRSAQYAAGKLQPMLQQKCVMQGGSEEIMVKFCLSMSASIQSDESRIVFSGHFPYGLNEFTLNDMLSSFGSLRSLVKDREGNYIAEFHSLHDSKQALLEIESSQLLGPQVQVNVSKRDPQERKKVKELLAILARWRQNMSRTGSVSSAYGGPGTSAPVPGLRSQQPNWFGPNHGLTDESPKHQFGPDAQYPEIIVPGGGMFPGQGGHQGNQKQQQIVQGRDGRYYLTTGTTHVYPNGGNFGHHHHQAPPAVISTGGPYYGIPSDASVSGRSSRSGHSSHSKYSTATTEERDNMHLALDLQAVNEGRDTRTSLMVRNIPNKYTRQMLLSEFDENGHGPGVIDFFYLPIDFKNRCNRGYAFINFVHFQDILHFHQRYYGKHWRTFNSDKICDITYARIQGKDAMLKRFENSALMEKDDEYKPMVFVSSGPNKGKRLPFPDPNRGTKGRVEV